jgi:hypothetical protein
MYIHILSTCISLFSRRRIYPGVNNFLPSLFIKERYNIRNYVNPLENNVVEFYTKWIKHEIKNLKSQPT